MPEFSRARNDRVQRRSRTNVQACLEPAERAVGSARWAALLADGGQVSLQRGIACAFGEI
jgi:hypothetical protein